VALSETSPGGMKAAVLRGDRMTQAATTAALPWCSVAKKALRAGG